MCRVGRVLSVAGGETSGPVKGTSFPSSFGEDPSPSYQFPPLACTFPDEWGQPVQEGWVPPEVKTGLVPGHRREEGPTFQSGPSETFHRTLSGWSVVKVVSKSFPVNRPSVPTGTSGSYSFPSTHTPSLWGRRSSRYGRGPSQTR